MTHTYLKILLLFAPAFILNNLLHCFIQNEGKLQDVKSVLKYAMIAVILLSTAIYSTIYFGAEQLVCIFNGEGNIVLQGLAVDGIKLYFIATPFIGFNIVMATYFTSTEGPRPAQIITLLRGLFVLVPTSYLLSHLFKMTGVWYAYPVTEALVAIIGCGLYAFTNKFKKV